MDRSALTVDLRDGPARDVSFVGGKCAGLSHMLHGLHESGVRVPLGFATTSAAWKLFLEHNNLEQRIQSRLDKVDILHDTLSLAVACTEIREWILESQLPPSVLAQLKHRLKGLIKVHEQPNSCLNPNLTQVLTLTLTLTLTLVLRRRAHHSSSTQQRDGRGLARGIFRRTTGNHNPYPNPDPDPGPNPNHNPDPNPNPNPNPNLWSPLPSRVSRENQPAHPS